MCKLGEMMRDYGEMKNCRSCVCQVCRVLCWESGIAVPGLKVCIGQGGKLLNRVMNLEQVIRNRGRHAAMKDHRYMLPSMLFTVLLLVALLLRYTLRHHCGLPVVLLVVLGLSLR